jgi:hypothetical protein
MKDLTFAFLPQIDDLLSEYDVLRERRDFHTQSFPEALSVEFVTSAMDLIKRVSGADGQFFVQTQKHLEQLDTHCDVSGYRVDSVAGGLLSLRKAVVAGYLVTVQEHLHAEVFRDFLTMAEYLLEDGYKDAAAVIGGGVLEEHLRKLCAKNGIPLEFTNSKGVAKPKSVETMNSDLANASVYSRLDQKNVTAWYDLRNKAAHGHYAEYELNQVRLLLHGVADFIRRYSA